MLEYHLSYWYRLASKVFPSENSNSKLLIMQDTSRRTQQCSNRGDKHVHIHKASKKHTYYCLVMTQRHTEQLETRRSSSGLLCHFSSKKYSAKRRLLDA